MELVMRISNLWEEDEIMNVKYQTQTGCSSVRYRHYHHTHTHTHTLTRSCLRSGAQVWVLNICWVTTLPSPGPSKESCAPNFPELPFTNDLPAPQLWWLGLPALPPVPSPLACPWQMKVWETACRSETHLLCHICEATETESDLNRKSNIQRALA